MPFGVVSEVHRWVSVLDGWLSSKGKGSFGVNVGHTIVNKGDFVA